MGCARPLPIVARVGVLSLLWVALSGKLDPVHLAFGAMAVALVAWMTRSIRIAQAPLLRRRPLGRLHLGAALRYPIWLLREVLLANVQMARLILDPRLPIDPVVVRFDSRLRSPLAQVLLANSITLTPGTFTIDVDEGVLTVHAITAAGVSATALGAMRGRVAQVFGEEGVPLLPVLEVRRGGEVETP